MAGHKWNRKRKAQGKKPRKRTNYTPIFQGNSRMEAYYALQGLHNLREQDGSLKECVSDQEREAERCKWIETLRTILPASFRIGNDVDPELRKRLEHEMDEYVGSHMEIEFDPSKGKGAYINPSEKKLPETTESGLMKKMVEPVRRISYVPQAYQLGIDRKTIRRNTKLEKFHDWLMAQTDAGFITRQETVSMIPPVVLDIKPHHVVLDMCAAPGSKTSQILELISLSKEGEMEPEGCVVANDSEVKRAYMLVHQLRRINSPCAFVTSCDAQYFPLLDGEGMFDRVLCDVPCSGDGTTRKNPGIWRSWNQLGALALHPLQLSIALNGARLTKVGGYMCYSTCSMNPVENEAVVAELLRASNGALELADKREDMPGIVARPGWTTWRVMKEEFSRRQEKNYQKKNNAKMKKRRQEWEAKQKREGEANAENIAKQENGDNAKKEDAEAEMEIKEKQQPAPTENGDNYQTRTHNVEKEDGVAKMNAAEKSEAVDKDSQTQDDSSKFARVDLGPPPSWDDEALLERCKSVGLLEYKSFEDVPEESRRRCRKTCFPPTAEENKKFHLEKCLRVLPQDMDTGGFFVALFRKVAPLGKKAKDEAAEIAKELGTDVTNDDGTAVVATPAESSATSEAASSGGDGPMGESTDMDVETTEKSQDDDSKPEKAAKRKGRGNTRGNTRSNTRSNTRGNKGKDNFLPIDTDIWESHVNFYGLAPTFPRDQFMKRACGDAKILYFIGKAVKTQFIDKGIQERLTVVNSGLKAFERNNKECVVQYRIAQEAIQYVAPHMTKRKVVARYDDFTKCLEPGTIRLEVFSDEFANSVRPFSAGSFCVALQGYENNVFKKMLLVMWRCRADSLNCLVSKVEIDAMKIKLRSVKENSSTEAEGGTKAIEATKE